MDSLLASVLDDLASAVEAVGYADPLPAGRARPSAGRLIDIYERVVARSLLDGVNPAAAPEDVPATPISWSSIYQSALGLDERTARYRVCQGCALEWGWRLFGPHLLIACRPGRRAGGQAGRTAPAAARQLIRLPPISPL